MTKMGYLALKLYESSEVVDTNGLTQGKIALINDDVGRIGMMFVFSSKAKVLKACGRNTQILRVEYEDRR